MGTKQKWVIFPGEKKTASRTKGVVSFPLYVTLNQTVLLTATLNVIGEIRRGEAPFENMARSKNDL